MTINKNIPISGKRGSDNQGDPQQVTFPELDFFINDIVRLSQIGLFVLALIAAMYMSRSILAPAICGLLVGFMFGPLSERLERYGLPPFFSSFLIVITVIVGVGGIFASLAVPLESWSSRIPEMGQQLTKKWEEIRQPLEKLKEVEKQVEEATKESDKPLEVVIKPKGVVTDMVSSAPEVLARIFFFIGIFYFFLSTRSRLRSGILQLCPTKREQLRIARIIRDCEYYLSRYVLSIALVNVALGFATGIVMYFLGIPSAHLWGTLAAFLNFVPYLGPAIMAITLTGVGLVTFPDVYAALAAPGAYLILNLFESQFVTPIVLGRSLTLNRLAVFFSLAFWLWLWGPVGALLSIPMLILATVAFSHIMPKRQIMVEYPSR